MYGAQASNLWAIPRLAEQLVEQVKNIAMHVVEKTFLQDFLVILKRPFQNYEEILKKCVVDSEL